jgi:hypothetical protein
VVREKEGGNIALSVEVWWRRVSIASATAAGGGGWVGGVGEATSGSGAGLAVGAFLELGGCEAARLSTGIPMKFLGEAKAIGPGAGRM